ncbi:unnamed protein product [Rotaria sp. Silwood2]|nr:unnamed protein product [Rotaria sp. Silwood2]
MALNILVIVEYGAQKQRISLNSNSSYKDICDQIYSLFKLDPSKSKYILQQQDSFKPGLFINVDERSFTNDLKQYATKNIKNPLIRLRLAPASSKILSKATNGVVNGEKAWSTSSQCQHDESDHVSCTSATTIDIKQLIKKCLTNLKGENWINHLISNLNFIDTELLNKVL